MPSHCRSRNVGFAMAALAAFGFFALEVCAKPVGKDEAAIAVRGWLSLPGRGLRAVLGNAVADTEVFADAKGAPLYYVLYLKPSGYVIMPADDLVEPIVCFSGSGKYVASDDNPLGALVTRDIPKRIALAQTIQRGMVPPKIMADAQQKWEQMRSVAAAPGAIPKGLSVIADPRVDPLIQSRWYQTTIDQDYCYNYYTPNHYVCGCVATAMAQVLRFWQYPTAGVGTADFSITVDGTSQTANLRGGDGNGGPYYWADMVLDQENGATETQRRAIGALCYDAGVAAHMSYASDGSGASPINASAALKNVFLYSNCICGGPGGENIGVGLNDMLNPNLDAGYPCLLSIHSPRDGHEIVADGYGYDTSTLYYHLNMGWAGSFDAWYSLPGFNADIDWDAVAHCIYNIYVTGSGEIISGRVMDKAGAPISGATVTASCGGGTYTAVSNSRGIYALAKVPAKSLYTISVKAPGYAFTPRDVSTGTSADAEAASGNVWAVNFQGDPAENTAPGGVAGKSFRDDASQAAGDEQNAQSNKLAYAMGLVLGQSLKESVDKFGVGWLLVGLLDGYQGNPSLLSVADSKAISQSFAAKRVESHGKEGTASASGSHDEFRARMEAASAEMKRSMGHGDEGSNRQKAATDASKAPPASPGAAILAALANGMGAGVPAGADSSDADWSRAAPAPNAVSSRDIPSATRDIRGPGGVAGSSVAAPNCQFWAVIVGVSKYKDSRIPQLRYAAADAKSFYDWIVSPQGGRYSPSNVRLLLDEDATTQNIKDTLFTWLKQAIKEDVILIYFSGHGAPDSPDGDDSAPKNLFLITHDTQADAIATTGFPMWDVETVLKRFVKAQKVVVVADACHSGGVGSALIRATRDGVAARPNRISAAFQDLTKIGNGVCVISASDDNQYSLEGTEWGGGHGVFTYFLLKGLSGGADYKQDGHVTLGELIPYLSEQVRRATQSSQAPVVAGRFDPALAVGR